MKNHAEIIRRVTAFLLMMVILFWAVKGALAIGRFSGWLYERQFQESLPGRAR